MPVKKQELEPSMEQLTGSGWRKRVQQGCLLSPCLFNLYAEPIMSNSGLEEVQAGIKIAGRNINNLKYEDNTTLMAEIRETQESPNEGDGGKSGKASLKLNIKKLRS